MSDFWERPDVVEDFAVRAPDHRLVHLIDAYPDPAAIRVLDLGCAGGRNTVLLAERGFDFWALDTSAAMVAHTRGRVATIVGPGAAERRVRAGRMDDLAGFADGTFHLVVALGVYHNARSRAEWERALDESARVLAPGGLLLVNQFTPEVDLTGAGVLAVADEPDVYLGLDDGNARGVLVDAPALDESMAARGLRPREPSETVRVETGRGRRVSINALFVRG